jgi:hypothetical protein
VTAMLRRTAAITSEIVMAKASKRVAT